MTHAQESTQTLGLEGPIFLPKDKLTLPELDKLKFAVMLLRGAGENLTTEQQGTIHAEIIAAEEAIRERDKHLGGVALSLVV